MPVSGRLFDTRASRTSTSRVRSSPGRKGASQRTSLTPGEPSEAVRPIKPSNISRIMTEQRCQPEPDSPLSIERLAAASSRCIGCGSNSPANSMMSSRVTWRGPNVPKRPGLKSSNVNVVMMGKFCRREARMWPLFAAISTRTMRMTPAQADSRGWSGLVRSDVSGLGQPLPPTTISISLGEDRCSIFRTCSSGTALLRRRSSRRSTGW